MIRYLLLAAVLFFVWRLIQVFNRMGGMSRQRRDIVHEEGGQQEKPVEFRDIKEAKFEELPPDKEKK
jgi:hypothetical protein